MDWTLFIVLGLVILAIVAGALIMAYGGKSKYQYLPTEQVGYPYYYQNLPPSLHVENNYHTCMLTDCNADYENYECRQKCYIKTMKDGTMDKADLICYKYRDSEEAYYECLDSVYGNYIWLDRNTGPDSCPCPPGPDGGSRTGYYDPVTLRCICRDKHAPLYNREPRNRFGEAEPYAIYSTSY